MVPRTLAQLPPGQRAVVRAVDRSSPIGERLLDLGFLPGTPVTAVSRAPLGDPTVYALRGTRFCLRRREAERVALAEADPVGE